MPGSDASLIRIRPWLRKRDSDNIQNRGERAHLACARSLHPALVSSVLSDISTLRVKCVSNWVHVEIFPVEV